jgi:MFS superfamily sulfate permease-like transporter
VLNVAGSVFFGAAGELQAALDPILDDRRIDVLVLRLKRARNLDVSSVEVLLAAAHRMHDEGRLMMLVGMRGFSERYLVELGAAEALDVGCFVPATEGQHWFGALEAALERAYGHVQAHRCSGCALENWVRTHPKVHSEGGLQLESDL